MTKMGFPIRGHLWMTAFSDELFPCSFEVVADKRHKSVTLSLLNVGHFYSVKTPREVMSGLKMVDHCE